MIRKTIFIRIENILLLYASGSRSAMSDAPLPADHLVRNCPQKQASVTWPMPVDMHLDRLLAQADAAGENTSRRELAAAIVASGRFTDDELGKLLRWYRTIKVRDLLSLPEGDNVVLFRKSRPGPRTTDTQP
jgi:hypothetical protein